MTIVALDRVALIHPLGDMGDRNIQGISTCIRSEEWLLEADVHHGKLGDVVLYRNTSVHIKGAPANWQWWAAIPTANIKAYRLADQPAPATLLADALSGELPEDLDEPEASHSAEAAQPATAKK